jgi:O-antigen ligase
MQKKITNICLFLTPACVFAFPGSYWLGALMFASIGIWMVARRQISFSDAITALRAIPMMWGFLIYITLYISLCIYHNEPPKDYGNVIPFLLAPLIFIAVSRNDPNPKFFWYGCATGALLAFSIAIAQIYFFSYERASGFRNPILFGDTAIVLGTGALIGLFYSRSLVENFWGRVYLLICGLSGLATSLLSGSKGGWLSLLMIIVLLANFATRSMHVVKRMAFVLTCLFVLLAVVALTPKLPVLHRVVSAYHGTVEWFETGRVTEGSASIRLEAFKAGLIAGAQSPILGLGKQRELAVFQDSFETGLIRKEMIELNVVDNDFISVFSRQGMVGVFSILAVHIAAILTFWRYRKEQSNTLKALSSFGILLVLLYAEFGLTVSIFSTTIFRTMYASWAILVAALIYAEKQRKSPGEQIA